MHLLRIFISGRPGIGKTTTFKKVVQLLVKEGYEVSGFYCPEVREPSGKRLGFKIVDIKTGKEGWIAKIPDLIEHRCERKIGRYCLIYDDAEIIAKSILEDFSNTQFVAIDEIGPMELSIQPLSALIYSSLASKNGLYVVHEKIVSRLSNEYPAVVYRIDEKNRDNIHLEIFQKIRSSLIL